MPDTNLDNWHTVRKRMGKAQEACDLVRIQKKDKHVHGTIIDSSGRFLEDSNLTKYIYHLID